MGLAHRCIFGLAGLLLLLGTSVAARGQQFAALPDDAAPLVSDVLPDTPEPTPDPASDESVSSTIFGVAPPATTGKPAKRFHLVVHPGEYTAPLSSGEKLELSVVSRFTLINLGSTLFSAGWSHMRDSSPHFGTDSGAFGERLGAIALKQTTQSIFNYGIYAAAFHDDPRYYVMGRQKSIAVRAAYSASRLLVTQTDDGRAAINWPKLAGIASAIALSNAYYPKRDHGFANGAESFGVSLGTTILSNEIDEFIGDGLGLLRHNRN